MLDIKFVRENPDIVKQNIKNKYQEKKLPLVDEVIALDEKSRSAKQEADALRANRNQLNMAVLPVHLCSNRSCYFLIYGLNIFKRIHIK